VNASAHPLVREFRRRGFGIVALVCAMVSAAVPVVISKHHVHQYELESQEILERFIENDLCFRPADLLDSPRSRALTLDHIAAFMEFGSLLEFRLWARDGTLVYSFLDRERIGSVLPEGLEHLEEARGGRIAEIVERPEAGAPPHGKLLELVAPIVVDGEVEGAVEVYRAFPEFRLLKSHIVLVVSITVATFVLLHLLLSGQFRRAATELVRSEDEVRAAYRSLGLSYFETIRGLVKALELRDMETEGHSERVVALSLLLGERLGLSRLELDHLVLGAYLHDIGKIGVPDAVLLKPGRLDPAERAIIETHVANGMRILGEIPFLRTATAVVLHHHERWDGGGYPNRVAGQEIPIAARIFAVVDVFDALVSDRPYRRAMSFAMARGVVLDGRGTQFDPEVVDAFALLHEADVAALQSRRDAAAVHAAVNAAVDHLLQQDGAPPAPAPAQERPANEPVGRSRAA
jgi:HD-GYP domain-containing protein (c-di-GMP phosphodiesterase class II)